METLQDMLIRHEGEVLHAYEDSEGFLTIGVGRLIDPRRGGGISKEESRFLLANDVKRAVSYANLYDWFGTLNSVRQQVIIDMLFNLGLQKFREFRKMLEALQNQDYEEASRQMLDSKWATQVKSRADELAKLMHDGA